MDFFLAGCRLADAVDLGLAEAVDPASPVGVEQGLAGFGVETGEELGTALNEGDVGAEGIQVMSHFEGDSAATKDNAGTGQAIGVEDVVAGPKRGLLKTWDGRDMGDGTGGDTKIVGAQRERGLAIDRADQDGVGILETGACTQQIKAAVLQLALAIAGEVFNKVAFACADGRDIWLTDCGIESELASAAKGEGAIGRLDEGFARHAAAQDAEATELGRAIDDGGFHAEGRSGASGSITGATAADDGEIERVHGK